MWFLTHVKTNKIHFLKKDKTSIGRVGSDIVLEGDASISRVHAHFIISGDTLHLQDANSKYGTFFIQQSNSQQVGDQQKELKDGDTIGFGKLKNNWIVHHVVQKTATSMLSQDTKAKLTKILVSLKVEITENLDSSCSHLTMNPQTMVSAKLLQALALCKPVVTPAFWISFKESIENDQPLPKSIAFAPQIKEDSLSSTESISLAPNEDRKKLFAGKSFLFMSTDQMNDFREVIRSAGGKVTNMTQVNVSMKECCAKNSIVVQIKTLATQTMSQKESLVLKVKSALAEKKRRVIPDNEIGLALMHCSINQWCNPDFLHTSLLPQNQSAQLTIAKSMKTMAEATDSMGFAAPGPSTRQGRGQLKKVPATVVATIDLESDDEPSKPENAEKTLTESQISLQPTQDTPTGVSIQDLSLPQTQSVMDSENNAPESEDSFVTANEFNKRSLRSGDSSNHVGNSFSTSTTSSQVLSTPLNASNLFNFTNTSISSAREQRKRKMSENVEPAEVSVASVKKPKKQDPVAVSAKPKQIKKKKPATNFDSSDEETQTNTSSRKRTAEAALGNDGGLFNFNTNFIKKTKPSEEESQVESNGVSGIIPLTKPTQSTITTVETFREDSNDSCDSGAWLSKKMTSFNLRDSTDGKVKVDVQEPNDSNAMNATEDIKPQNLAVLFDVLETTVHNNSTSSMVSKRKSFVKKQNFRPQHNVVTTKLILIDDTYKRHENF